MADQKLVGADALSAIASDIKQAIGEKADKYTDVSGTLSAGNTSIELSNDAISSSSTVDIYTEVYGITPETVTVMDGKIVLTFESQDVDISVKARIT